MIFPNVQKKLTILYVLTSEIILTAALAITAVLYTKFLYQKQTETFQANIFHVVSTLQNGSAVSDSWLDELSYRENLLIHIEENGTPLLYNTSDKLHAGQETLIQTAKDYIRENYLTSITGSSYQSPLFKVTGAGQGTFLCAYISLSNNRHYQDIYLLNDISHLKSDGFTLLFYLLLIEFVSCICLFYLGHRFVRLALTPVRENQKLQNDFIAAASHELRSPVMLIQNAASSAQQFHDQTDYFHNLIQQECMRMSSLIQDLLTLTISPSDTEEVFIEYDPDTLLLEIYEKYLTLCKAKNLHLRLESADYLTDSPTSIPGYLSQVIRIFLDNAIAYSPSGETVTLRMSVNKNDIYFSVIDHGCGIADEDKKKVCQRFYQGDISRSSKEHFGLGLSIAQKYTTSLRGKILLEDTPGGGCTFILKCSYTISP